jgi:hypothetical protein
MPRAEDHDGYVATRAIKPGQLLPVSIRVNAALLRIAAGQRTKLQRYRRQLGELPPEPTTPHASVRARTGRGFAALRSRLRRR